MCPTTYFHSNSLVYAHCSRVHSQIATLLCCSPTTQWTEMPLQFHTKPLWLLVTLMLKLHTAGNSAVASRNIKERTFLLNGDTQQYIKCRISHIIAWHQFSVTISANIQDAGGWWVMSGRQHLKWELVDQGQLAEPLCCEMGFRKSEDF